MTLAVNLANLANYVNASGKLDAQNGLFNATFGVTEPFTTLTGTAGNIAADVSLGATLFYTTTLNGATTFSATNISALLSANNQAANISLISAQSASSNFINTITLAGATTVTTRWFSNSPPISGSASGFDLYQFNILRTGAGLYTVLITRIGY